MAEVNIQKQLKDLIEGTTMNWTYAMVWRYSFDHRSAIKWRDGYCKLLGSGKKTKEVRIFGSTVTVTDEEVTDAEYFFKISMAKWFLLSEADLPGHFFFLSRRFVWLTGSEELLGSQWKRAKQAQEHGIQTLFLIPVPTGVMELGSTQIIPFAVERLEGMITLSGTAAVPRMRSSAQTWEKVSETLINDGHQWEETDQREILGNTYTRSYYRCIHKIKQGCQATKQVQRIQEEPPLYKTTYYGHHDHREARSLPERADDEMQNPLQDIMYKQSRGKEKISDSKCSLPLLTESSDRGTDRTFSYSHEYSGPS